MDITTRYRQINYQNCFTGTPSKQQRNYWRCQQHIRGIATSTITLWNIKLLMLQNCIRCCALSCMLAD